MTPASALTVFIIDDDAAARESIEGLPKSMSIPMDHAWLGVISIRPTARTLLYAELVTSLLELKARNFYIVLAGEKHRGQVLKVIRKHLKPDQRIFVGVITPTERYMEAPEGVRVRSFELGEKRRWCYVDG